MMRATSRSRSELLRKYAAPLILAAVACFQIARAQIYEQSSWHGVGFGMFATIERPNTRIIHCYITTSDGRFPVRLGKSLRPLVLETQVVPTQANLERLADATLRASWGRDDGGAEKGPRYRMLSTAATTDAVEILGVEIRQGQLVFDASARRLDLDPKHEISRYVEGGPP